MFLPGIGIMTWKDAQPRIPWGTIVLFGIGISVGTALLQTKGASWLADLAVVQFGLKNATALFVLAVLSLFLTLIHLGLASATALASAMIPIVIAVLQGVATPGINIVGMTMLLQFVVSFGFILVVNAPQNMVAYGTETFDAKDFMRTGLVLTVIAGLGHAAWRNLLALARLRLSETAREPIATEGMTSNQAFNASIGSLFHCRDVAKHTRCKVPEREGKDVWVVCCYCDFCCRHVIWCVVSAVISTIGKRKPV